MNLSQHERNPSYYNRDRDMWLALAWNAIKKTLTEVGQEKLFEYITSVRLTEKNIIITTGKPLVNAELRMCSEEILLSANMSFAQFQSMKREKIIFK